ncbi:MAG: hypothetical protein D6815_04005 [Candidatus Dadabacteria bacterium]|nr:MAG: hypothetical protein D6815_04005 [Candidatus Dadabacteria bacterium]
MITPRPAEASTKAGDYDFLFGYFAADRLTIPYFQVCMTFRQAAESLVLVSDLPGVSKLDWTVEELFQREIDWQRVRHDIVPYLRREAGPHFFNSLTIALVPFDGDRIRAYDDPVDWVAPRLDHSNYSKQATFGPVRCGYWGQWEDPRDPGARLGQLCWNKEQIYGVAIDGQHRLAAIKELVRDGGPASGKRAAISVLLLVLDPRLGFAEGVGETGYIATLRQLFIDLNKHARPVSRARQILLDDRDPGAVCVRALVGRKLTHGFGELHQHPARLPLTLVDWHSEQAKFDDGPYLTTILGLDYVVTRVLKIPGLRDPVDYDRLERDISGLERLVLTGELDEAKRRLKECRERERPFYYTDEEMKRIAGAFAGKWADAIAVFLSEFAPYTALIELRSRLRTDVPEFGYWYSLKAQDMGKKTHVEVLKRLQSLETALRDSDSAPTPSEWKEAVGEIEEFKESCALAFAVVFQKACFLALVRLTGIGDSGRWLPSSTEPGVIDLDGEFDDEPDEGNPEDSGGRLDWNAPVSTHDGSTSGSGEETTLEVRRAKQLAAGLNALYKLRPGSMETDFLISLDRKSDIAEYFWLGTVRRPAGGIDFTNAAAKRAADLLALLGYFQILKEESPQVAAGGFDAFWEEVAQASQGLMLRIKQAFGRLTGQSSRSGRINQNDNSVAGQLLRLQGYDKEKLDEERELELRRNVILRRVRLLWEAVFGASSG